MSLWNTFTGWAKNIASDITGVSANYSSAAIQTGAGLATPQVAQMSGAAAPQTVQGLQNAAQQAIAKTTPSGINPNQASSDLLLQASKPVGEVFSKYVNRPVAAAGLLTDPNSPLYSATGPGGISGFISDAKKAYDRSAKVSPFVALTKSSLFQDSVFGHLTDSVLKQGNIDVKNVNLWDDKDIKKNYVDNTIGKIFSGTGDFIVSNVAGAKAVSVLGKAGSYASKATNLTTNIDNVNDLQNLDNLATSHINGTNQTVFGADVQQLAETQDMNLIVKKVRDYSNNDQLPTLIQKTNNPSIIKDLLLADKGYQPALDRLLSNNPADLWQLGDYNSFVKGNVTATGILPTYKGEALKNVHAAYDQSISDVPSHQQIYEAFHDGSGSQIVQGTSYKPIDPPIFGGTIGAARTRLSEIGASVGTRNYENLGGISETVLGGGLNRPITVLTKFVGTSKPRGYVTYQGLRPWDGVDELNAIFDDVRAFNNGKNPITTGFDEINGKINPQTISAAEYRTKAINDFMNASTSTEKDAVIAQLDKDLVKHIAFTNGIYDTDQIESFAQNAQGILSGFHNKLAQDGFAFDAANQRIIVDPVTQRQLADSRAMLPHGKIERDIRAAAKGGIIGFGTETTPAALHAVFEGLNKTFAAAVLGKPSYIPKNSIAEPLITSFLSMGHVYAEDSVISAIKNGVENNKNRLLKAITKTTSRSDLAAVNKKVTDLQDSVYQALHILDTQYASYEEVMNGKNISPATKAQHIESVRADLNSTQRLIERLEADIRVSSKNYGMSETVPSAYNLRRRIDFLKSQGASEGPYAEKATRYASEIRTAELSLQKALGNITTLTPNLIEHNKTIESAWKLLDKVVAEKGLAEKEQAAIIGRIEKYTKRYYGSRDPLTVKVGNQTLNVDQLTSGKFAEAIKNEFSNEDTVTQNFLSESRIGAKQKMLASKSHTGVVQSTSPLYYEELAYVVNRAMRGDPLVDQVLNGTSTGDIMEWSNTMEGQRYLRQFGKEVPSDVKSIVQDKIDFVNRYLPDPAARAYATQGDVNSIGLQKILANKQDILMPISSNDIDYGSAASLGKPAVFAQNVKAAFDSSFRYLMAAENPYRWLWADKKFGQVIEQKLNVLHEQGVPITAEQANATRQAAAREALTEAGKVFYTIRRQNRALYAARTVAAFPTASASALYRFGRLAAKYPGRTAGFMRNYYSLYDTFAVDKDGNPVDDPTKAAYIVVPGTKEMGLFADKGIRLSTKSFGFLVNAPGPSFLSTFAVQNILNQKPDNEQFIKRIVDDTIGHIPGMNYDSMFPTSNTAGTSSFIPSWVSNLKKGLIGTDSNADFLATHKMVHNYLMTLSEMKLAKAPTWKQEMDMTKSYYRQKAGWQFGSPFGIAPQIDKPGQMWQDLATITLKKYNGDFNKAQAEMLQILGPSFSADRYLYRGNTKSTYVSPTLKGYDRVIKDNPELVTKLAKNDPVTVGLLSADLSGDPANQQVQSFLLKKNITLPGGTPLNTAAKTVDAYETQLQVNRVWNTYRDVKQKLLDEVRKSGYKRVADVPGLADQWNSYVTQLGAYNKDWGLEYKQSAGGDKSITYAQALKDIVSDPKFMQKSGSNDFWKQVSTFVKYRDIAIKAYKDAPKGSKSAVQSAWQTYLQEDTAGSWNPQLQQIIDRYFVNDSMKETN